MITWAISSLERYHRYRRSTAEMERVSDRIELASQGAYARSLRSMIDPTSGPPATAISVASMDERIVSPSNDA